MPLWLQFEGRVEYGFLTSCLFLQFLLSFQPERSSGPLLDIPGPGEDGATWGCVRLRPI